MSPSRKCGRWWKARRSCAPSWAAAASREPAARNCRFGGAVFGPGFCRPLCGPCPVAQSGCDAQARSLPGRLPDSARLGRDGIFKITNCDHRQGPGGRRPPRQAPQVPASRLKGAAGYRITPPTPPDAPRRAAWLLAGSRSRRRGRAASGSAAGARRKSG